MTVGQIIAEGLKVKAVADNEIKQQVESALVKLSWLKTFNIAIRTSFRVDNVNALLWREL